MRAEIIRWVKFITVVWPLTAFIATLACLAVFYLPLRRILERFDSEDIERLKIGSIEMVKRSRPKPTRARRRKKN